LTKIKGIRWTSGSGLFLRFLRVLRRKGEPLVVDQVLQPMRRDIECNDLAGLLLAGGLRRALGLQHAVDLFLDLGKLGFRAAGPDAPAKRIKRIQRLPPASAACRRAGISRRRRVS
jgi:hypothetical protein